MSRGDLIMSAATEAVRGGKLDLLKVCERIGVDAGIQLFALHLRAWVSPISS